MNNASCGNDFAIWKERSVIADCLRDLGMDDFAAKAIKPDTQQELIEKFLSIIQIEAYKLKKHDVLEKLSFAGLIYG